VKVRITTDHVRIRLREDEVRMLSGGESVSCVVNFGTTGTLIHELVPSATAERIEATLSGSHVRILLPSPWLKDWPDSERVGFEADSVSGEGESISILVERDFPCKH